MTEDLMLRVGFQAVGDEPKKYPRRDLVGRVYHGRDRISEHRITVRHFVCKPIGMADNVRDALVSMILQVLPPDEPEVIEEVVDEGEEE